MDGFNLLGSGEIARLSRQLRLIRLRQAARETFDLIGFGSGTAERLAAAMVFGAAFFGLFLVAAILLQFSPVYVLTSAFAALALIVAPSVFLILGPTDDGLEDDAEVVRHQLAIAVAQQTARAAAQPQQISGTIGPSVQLARVQPARVQPALAPRCRFCAEEVLPGALKCKHCGEYLDERLRRERTPSAAPLQLWNPGVAAVLSFVLPGLGQIYKGQIFNGLTWLAITLAGYVCCIVPGLWLHLFCIIGAASGNPYSR